MLNLNREYFALEKDRMQYQTKFTDKSKCVVYGRKKFITEAGKEEFSAHVFEISKDFWTFNAGNLDFSNYPDRIWNDYISVDIIQKEEYTNPHVHFGSMGDINPENLQALSEYLTKHLSDLEKRIVEDYLYIDEGVSENIGLPNLPENHFWVRKNGIIVGVNLDYLKDDYEFLKGQLQNIFREYSKKTLEHLSKKLKEYYKELIDKIDLDFENIKSEIVEEIKKALTEYLETDIKPEISQYKDDMLVIIYNYVQEHKENLKGDKGDRGEQGIQGIRGPQGQKGEQGEVGPQGLQGLTGPQGPEGEQGPVGVTGPQGVQGIQGPQGEQGDIGPQGPQGIQGIKGDKGDKGDTGANGITIPIESGRFAMTVEGNNLVMYYNEGTTPPKYEINENGELVEVFETEEEVS